MELDIKYSSAHPDISEKIELFFPETIPRNQLVDNWAKPEILKKVITKYTGSEVIILGPYEERVMIINNLAANFGEKSLGSLPVNWRSLEKPNSWISNCRIKKSIDKPLVGIASLYIKTNFPLPRFPLGISCLARSIRRMYKGTVSLYDMQLGESLEEVTRKLLTNDIIGVSATFGQNEIFEKCLNQIFKKKSDEQIVVVGGSLPALNAEYLTGVYPGVIIATGPGEKVMCDVVTEWDSSGNYDEIDGTYRKNTSKKSIRLNRPKNNSIDVDFLPELDLLDLTLETNGVYQLESSRGCTHACSFCPRDHKGLWSGQISKNFKSNLEAAKLIFEQTGKRKKVFLVDEEYVGRSKNFNVSNRAVNLSRDIYEAGFVWETSSRLDQVTRLELDHDWHKNRAEMWSMLKRNGMERCLFGLESGVNSILKRFNKHTKQEQIITALRTLTSLDIPIRLTYITFDHLMDIDELIESYKFLGRNDIILNPNTDVEIEDLVNLVRNDTWAAENSSPKPLYHYISYMLVSMECLKGSPYLEKVKKLNLVNSYDPMMGRYKASFKDPKIGMISDWAQRWVDRNFSFDYTLKSLEKISDGITKQSIRELRFLIRTQAYIVLGNFIDCYSNLKKDSRLLREICNENFIELVSSIHKNIPHVKSLPKELTDILNEEYLKWSNKSHWKLIN